MHFVSETLLSWSKPRPAIHWGQQLTWTRTQLCSIFQRHPIRGEKISLVLPSAVRSKGGLSKSTTFWLFYHTRRLHPEMRNYIKIEVQSRWYLFSSANKEDIRQFSLHTFFGALNTRYSLRSALRAFGSPAVAPLDFNLNMIKFCYSPPFRRPSIHSKSERRSSLFFRLDVYANLPSNRHESNRSSLPPNRIDSRWFHRIPQNQIYLVFFGIVSNSWIIAIFWIRD